MTHQFELSTEDFAYLRQLALEYAGINLNEHKQMLVYNRLVKRLRALKLPNFKTYCELLKANDLTEHRFFIDAITTTVTAFFRENHHFQFLQNEFLPQWFAKQNPSRKLHIWSAGCASGEEAYSIAMIVKESQLAANNWPVEILATDLNLDALAIAKAGIYPLESIEKVELERKKRWFRKGVGQNTGYVQLKSEIRQMVNFRELNLIEKWSMAMHFDIIFCRNVVIYFNKQTQEILFNKFANILQPDGLLMVGHSESLYKISKRFQHLGNNIYRIGKTYEH